MTPTVTMNTNQAAEYLGLAVSTMNKWRVYGGGPKFLKLGRSIRYRKPDPDQYLEEVVRSSTAEY